ncbi:MAG: DUF1295 domain-containing protein [Thalassovita sp.]
MSKSGGINRAYGRSLGAKLTFAFLHGLLVALCIWLAFGPIDWINTPRAQLLCVCVIVYFLRHLITLFVLLKRQVQLSEVFGLILFFCVFEVGFLLLGTGEILGGTAALSWIDAVAFGLFLIGSALNSVSELQRWVWKKKPSSKGLCYTEGLFAYSLHINYFGDAVLFTGWAILTASLIAWAVPLFVISGFVFFHIPPLDQYLEERYGDSFNAYAAKTAKFVPFLY